MCKLLIGNYLISQLCDYMVPTHAEVRRMFPLYHNSQTVSTLAIMIMPAVLFVMPLRAVCVARVYVLICWIKIATFLLETRHKQYK